MGSTYGRLNFRRRQEISGGGLVKTEISSQSLISSLDGWGVEEMNNEVSPVMFWAIIGVIALVLVFVWLQCM